MGSNIGWKCSRQNVGDITDSPNRQPYAQNGGEVDLKIR
jgi:hypothetical protein